MFTRAHMQEQQRMAIAAIHAPCAPVVPAAGIVDAKRGGQNPEGWTPDS